MRIYETTDYKIFKKSTGNRLVKKRMVERLVNSITHNNLLHANPVIVNKSMEVIDGQHRVQAAKDMARPVFYVVVEDADIETVRLLNANAKAWLPADFVNSYADLGNKDYITLRTLMNDYEMAVSTILPLFYPSLRHSEQLDHVRGGTFKATNLELATTILNMVVKWGKYAEKNVYKDRSFVTAVFKMAGMGDRFDVDRMDTKLRETHQGQPIILRGNTVQDYLRQLEEIYNHGLHNENRVRFF